VRLDLSAVVHELPLRLSDLSISPVPVVDDDADSAMPAELRAWLVRLRLLEGVPFANIVADAELLPPESIRWFYVDRRWTDALVQGALSVGTVTTDDRAHLSAAYPAIQAELDDEERNVRRGAAERRFTGGPGPISGFLLRSQAVAGWPAVHVRAFDVDPPEGDDGRYHERHPNRMRLLRLERLAPAVLLCLVDGIPVTVHVEEPRQGVQFGVEDDPADDTHFRLPVRDPDSFDDVGEVDVPFRAGGGSGVIDIQQLERALSQAGGAGADATLDSAEYALQLIRFPYRQVWGEPRNGPLTLAFRPSIAYRDLTRLFKERP
jgi:hypothetical protein